MDRSTYSLIALLLIGCERGPKHPDAIAIVRAYEAFQNAAPTDKTAALQSFESTQCTPMTCADRDACSKYGKLLTRAQELARKARELGPEDAGGNGAASESELAIIIGGADDATKAATAAEPDCRKALERLYALTR
jgi:hypothetical protein